MNNEYPKIVVVTYKDGEVVWYPYATNTLDCFHDDDQIKLIQIIACAYPNIVVCDKSQLKSNTQE